METIENVLFENRRIYMRSSLGKVYSRPLEAFPLLAEATDAQRAAFRIVARGEALRWNEIDEDIHISSFHETAEPDPDNEVAAIFRRFPQLNISEVARDAGINKCLLTKYIYGISHPSAERLTRIKETLRRLGRELAAV